MSKHTAYIGTYTDKDSRGVYKVIFDSVKGVCEGPWLFYELQSCKALHCLRGELAIVCEQKEHAGVTLLDVHQPVPFLMDTKYSEGVASCFITQDEQHIYTANYHEGSLCIYTKEHGKLRLKQRFRLGEKAKCHQVFLLDGYLFLVCLGMDCIRIYDPENHYSFVKDIVLPKGCGPRQVEVDKEHRYMYVLTERSNEVYVYTIGAHHTYRCQQINSVLPAKSELVNTSAAIHLSPNGKYLYTSTRGEDIITSFEVIDGYLRQKEYFQSGGQHPRDFIIDESGRWLLVLNRDSDNLVVFKLNPDTGEVEHISDEKSIPSGVAIDFQ